MRDHLGSVREVMKNASSTVEARHDYDPWGRQTQTTGTRVFDIGYAGYMVFAPTGTNIKLNLTWYRAYSPELGRWLSRDPIEERGGLNLYGYVRNKPIKKVDPLGLTPESCAACYREKMADCNFTFQKDLDQLSYNVLKDIGKALLPYLIVVASGPAAAAALPAATLTSELGLFWAVGDYGWATGQLNRSSSYCFASIPAKCKKECPCPSTDPPIPPGWHPPMAPDYVPPQYDGPPSENYPPVNPL